MAKRVGKELKLLLETPPAGVADLKADEEDPLHWTGVLVPDQPPFNVAAFAFDIRFPDKYPFAPPAVTLTTPMLHPNVDDKGLICLSIVDAQKWKPATKMEQVFGALLQIIHEPEPDHPLREDLAEKFMKDRKAFNKAAADHAKKHGIKQK